MPLQRFVVPFAAGCLAVVVFHQGLLAIFAATGLAPNAAGWVMTPVPPLGTPQLISTAFWGGIWGIVLSELRAPLERKIGFWPLMIVVGGLLTTLVALFLVGPIKGRPFAAGWSPQIWARALALNGAWGLGLGIFLKLFRRV